MSDAVAAMDPATPTTTRNRGYEMNSFMVCSFCKSLLVLLLLGGIDIQFYERVPLQYYSLLASTSLIEQHHSIDLTDANRFFFRDPPTRVPENHPNGRSGVCIDLFVSFINTKVKFCEPVSSSQNGTREHRCRHTTGDEKNRLYQLATLE